MIGGAKGIGIGIDFGIPNQYCRATNKPYIEKDVLDSLRVVASAYGKTNNYSDRAIVKNLVDPDNPFIISNAAYEGMSGYNGYPVVFGANKTYANLVPNDGNFILTSSHNIINVTKFDTSHGLLYSHIKLDGKLTSRNIDYPSYKIKVTGLGENFGLHYSYLESSSDTTVKGFEINNDGIYIIPKSFASDGSLTSNSDWIGFIFTGTAPESCNVTIEVLPEYEGAFVTDGIDDLITSTKTVQEMLGGSTEFTAVSMIHLTSVGQSVDGNAYTNYIRTSDNYWVSNRVSNTDKTGIYGYSFKQGTPTVINNILGDKNDYTAEKSDDVSEIFRAKFSVEGFEHVINGAVHVSSVAWYWTIIANKVLTTDQINQVIAYYNLDRTLKPDILCNVKKQRITNENHAEFGDKLIDFSGNGRDIQLNNIAWKGDSGIGKYSADFGSFDWATNISQKQHNKATISLNGRLCNHTAIEVDEMKVNIIGNVTELIYWYIANPDDTTRSEIRLTSGINTLPKSYAKDDGQTYNIGFAYISGDSEITIEQIPSHAGALCLDGVNDFGKVTGLPAYKDYTTIIDYQRFDIGYIEGKGTTGILSKAHAAGQGAFLMNLIGSTGTHMNSYSFGTANANTYTDLDRQIYYQTKYKMQGFDMTAGTGVDGDSMWLALVRDNDSRFFNGAIYSLMSFPYSMSEFLIERQLKKHKLGTLYPNMVEFRPVIKSSVELVNKPSFAIRGTSTLLNAGDYIPENSEIWVVITMNNVADRITKFVINGNTIDIPSSAYNPSTMKYGFPFTIDSKSPQKITMTIEQDENYVKWNPVVESNVEYQVVDSYIDNYPAVVGNYYPINSQLRIAVTTKGAADEVTSLTINGTSLGTPSVNGNRFTFNGTLSDKSPQKIDITIDEYIRYEDIVQPYPMFFEFYNENNELFTWGGKVKVGSTITRTKGVAYSNLLEGLYTITNPRLNGVQLVGAKHTVEKQMVFTCDATYIKGSNAPKCILSPRLLRIPNSSYKILGYIPDISGHGNHGKINNSAYAEGSGVNEDGSYQFDGVDDFVTIPTTVGGKQVLMKVNWDTTNASILYDQRGYNNEFAIYNGANDSDGNPIPAYQGRNNGQTYIDGILNSNIKALELRAITHNITITNELSSGTNNTYPIIGSSKSNAYFVNMALYDFMLFDGISTDDKIKELNEYVGIEGNTE